MGWLNRIGGILGRVYDNYVKPAAGVIKDFNIPIVSNIAKIIDGLGTSNDVKEKMKSEVINKIQQLTK